MRLKNTKFITLLIALFFTTQLHKAEAAPTVSSFTTGTNSAFSGQLINVSWSGDGSGYNLLVTCAQGVKVKNENGSAYPCDTKSATSAQNSDSHGFYLVNISGSPKSVTFKIYPKDSNGLENTGAEKTQTVTISPAPVTINSLSASASSTLPGVSVSISWSSNELDGINMIFSCVDGVSVFASSTNLALPCGTLAFSDKLSGSGNINVLFKNKNSDRSTVSLNVLPYIGNGGYDLTHAQPLSFDVAIDKTLPPQIISFAPSQPKVASGDTFSLVWSTKNANGVNLKIDCAESLSFSLATTSGGQTIMCNSLVSDTYFAPNSSVNLVFNNTSSDVKNAYVKLLPQLSGGGFDGINARTISIQVAPKGQAVIFSTTTQSVSSTTNTSSSSKSLSKPKKKFLKALSVGSRGDDVSALQDFLLKSGYYPNGEVTGYFGNMTKQAVQRFQEAQGIAKPGQAGYGNFGPATRSKLNSI